jgi:hypothetical protein
MFCHTACMKQTSVKGFAFFGLEQKRKPWLNEGACWASLFTGCLLKGSKWLLRAFRSLWILTRYYRSPKGRKWRKYKEKGGRRYKYLQLQK